MPSDLPPGAPTPAGIGTCRECAYLQGGTAEICYRCARQTIEALAPLDERCEVCDLPLTGDGTCGNPICSWDDRQFDWNYAIAMRSGVLERAISRFRYESARGWRVVFARVLVGFLDDSFRIFRPFDLVAASPTFLADDEARHYDHTREVILAAHEEAEGRWPFDVEQQPTIVKTRGTPRMVGLSWKERKTVAEEELRPALYVPDPARVRNKGVLVYDDVFTDGFTLNEVARCLRRVGARTVCGVTLTRQPWNR